MTDTMPDKIWVINAPNPHHVASTIAGWETHQKNMTEYTRADLCADRDEVVGVLELTAGFLIHERDEHSNPAVKRDYQARIDRIEELLQKLEQK